MWELTSGFVDWDRLLVLSIVALLIAMAPMTTGAQISPLFEVAVTAGGEGALSAAFDGTNFLIGIQGDASSDHNIVGQQVDSDGHLIGDLISTGRTGGFPFVAFGGGNYLMVWTDDATSPNDDIYGQLVGTSGTLVGSAFPIGGGL